MFWLVFLDVSIPMQCHFQEGYIQDLMTATITTLKNNACIGIETLEKTYTKHGYI